MKLVKIVNESARKVPSALASLLSPERFIHLLQSMCDPLQTPFIPTIHLHLYQLCCQGCDGDTTSPPLLLTLIVMSLSLTAADGFVPRHRSGSATSTSRGKGYMNVIRSWREAPRLSPARRTVFAAFGSAEFRFKFLKKWQTSVFASEHKQTDICKNTTLQLRAPC